LVQIGSDWFRLVQGENGLGDKISGRFEDYYDLSSTDDSDFGRI
jgi:hypothetical protein